MFKVDLAELTMLTTSFQQATQQVQLLTIAIVNAIVWVGMFLFMLRQLNRWSKRVEDRVSRLEASMTDDDKSSVK